MAALQPFATVATVVGDKSSNGRNKMASLRPLRPAGSSVRGAGKTLPAGARVFKVHAEIAPPVTFLTAKVPAVHPVISNVNLPDPKTITRTPFMAGNWKTNPTTLQQVHSLTAMLATMARNTARDKPDLDVEVAVFPPSVFLPVVKSMLADTNIQVGVQDVHFEQKGAFTGSVAVGMVASLGCTHALVGHSERRSLFGDDDDSVNKKVRAVLDAGLKPILCIGETKEEYVAGKAQAVCARQLAGALHNVSAEEMRTKVTIAYEPVWAIGTGLTATPAIAQSMHAYIRQWMTDVYGAQVSHTVRIQYGGSVTPETVDTILACPDVDGCLVGGASLLPDKFQRICNVREIDQTVKKLWAQEVVGCGCQLGESPVWDNSRQKMYWVDAPGQRLWEWDLATSARKWQFSETVGCVALMESDGHVLLGLERGMCDFNLETGAITTLSDFETGRNTRPNDGRTDKDGNFVIGSYNNNHRGDAKEIGGLWRMDAMSNKLTEILDYSFRCSNAICFTPDGSKMFFCDTPTRRVYTFDYNSRAPLSNRQLLYEMPNGLEGGPDGAQCDNMGHLWVAISGAGQVVRIGPDGLVNMTVELPVKCPTSCTFGGADLATLYITTRGPDGGGLYAVDLPEGVRGQVEPEYRSSYTSRGGGGFFQSDSKSNFCEMCGTPFSSAGGMFCAGCGSRRS